MAASNAVSAGKAYVEMMINNSSLIKGIDTTKKKFESLGNGFLNVGTKMAAIFTAAMSPLLGSSISFAKTGDSINKLSQKTGIGTKELSTLGYAAKQSGSDVETLAKGVLNIQRNLVDAADGSESAADKFKAMGINFKDIINLKPDEQFKVVAEAISRIKDPAKRNAAALDLLGRSGKELMPMMMDGVKGIETLQRRARDFDLEIDPESAQQATELGDTFDDLFTLAKNRFEKIGQAIAPVLLDIANYMIKAIKATNDFIVNNKGLIQSVFKITSAIGATAVSVIILGYSFKTLATALSVVKPALLIASSLFSGLISLIAAISSPMGVLIGTLAMLGFAFFKYSAYGQAAFATISDAFKDMYSVALDAIKGMTNAFMAGDITLAAKVLWSSLKLIWTQGVNALMGTWIDMKKAFSEAIATMWYGSQAILVEGWTWMQKTWVNTIAGLSSVWTSFISVIKTAWNDYSTWMSKKMLDLWKLWDDTFGDGTFDIEFAKSNIDIDSKNNQNKIDTDRDNKLNEIGQANAQTNRELNASRDKSMSDIGNADAAEKAARSKEYAKQIEDAQNDVANAMKDFKDNLSKTTDTALNTKERTPILGLDDYSDPSIYDKIGEGIKDVVKNSVEAKGQFAYDSKGYEGLNAGGAMSAENKTASNTEKTYKELQKVNKELRNRVASGYLDLE